MKTKFIAMLSLLGSLAAAGLASNASDKRAPEVPPSLQVPEGYRVSCHAYAIGVQIYLAAVSPTDPTKLVWTFAAPEAVLYDAEGEIVGIHYAHAGPTRPAWESQSGSIVVGARTVPPVTIDSTAVPWLVLDGIQSTGPGIFKNTAYIQRVNTTGGLAPGTPPTHVGQEVRIPYTAEYFFYRMQK